MPRLIIALAILMVGVAGVAAQTATPTPEPSPTEGGFTGMQCIPIEQPDDNCTVQFDEGRRPDPRWVNACAPECAESLRSNRRTCEWQVVYDGATPTPRPTHTPTPPFATPTPGGYWIEYFPLGSPNNIWANANQVGSGMSLVADGFNVDKSSGGFQSYNKFLSFSSIQRDLPQFTQFIVYYTVFQSEPGRFFRFQAIGMSGGGASVEIEVPIDVTGYHVRVFTADDFHYTGAGTTNVNNYRIQSGGSDGAFHYRIHGIAVAGTGINPMQGQPPPPEATPTPSPTPEATPTPSPTPTGTPPDCSNQSEIFFRASGETECSDYTLLDLFYINQAPTSLSGYIETDAGIDDDCSDDAYGVYTSLSEDFNILTFFLTEPRYLTWVSLYLDIQYDEPLEAAEYAVIFFRLDDEYKYQQMLNNGLNSFSIPGIEFDNFTITYPANGGELIVFDELILSGSVLPPCSANVFDCEIPRYMDEIPPQFDFGEFAHVGTRCLTLIPALSETAINLLESVFNTTVEWDGLRLCLDLYNVPELTIFNIVIRPIVFFYAALAGFILRYVLGG